MDMWQRIRASEEPVMKQSIGETISEHSLIRDALSLLIEGLEKIFPFKDDDAMLVRVSLLSHNLNNLMVSFDSSRRGYYVQALSILKNVYENWLAFWYLAQFPEDAHLWIDPRWDRRPYKAETMRNKMEHPSTSSKSKLHGFYEELNRFAHTDPIDVISRLKPEEGRTIIGIGVRYDKDSFLACCYALSLWVGISLME